MKSREFGEDKERIILVVFDVNRSTLSNWYLIVCGGDFGRD